MLRFRKRRTAVVSAVAVDSATASAILSILCLFVILLLLLLRRYFGILFSSIMQYIIFWIAVIVFAWLFVYVRAWMRRRGRGSSSSGSSSIDASRTQCVSVQCVVCFSTQQSTQMEAVAYWVHACVCNTAYRSSHEMAIILPNVLYAKHMLNALLFLLNALDFVCNIRMCLHWRVLFSPIQECGSVHEQTLAEFHYLI